MKYVIDIDGTICTTKSGDYDRSIPIIERIAFVNNLFEKGHKVVYFTARGMGSSNENQEAASLKWFNFTKNQLESWGAKHHELIMGKPSADYYIDDKCESPSNFFNNSEFKVD